MVNLKFLDSYSIDDDDDDVTSGSGAGQQQLVVNWNYLFRKELNMIYYEYKSVETSPFINYVVLDCLLEKMMTLLYHSQLLY